MPYGTPVTQPWNREYQIDVTHDGLSVGLTLVRGSGGEETDVDAAVQAFVDLVAASPDFSVTGFKFMPSAQSITAT